MYLIDTPTLHLAEAAPLSIKSMFECELLAIFRAFEQAASYSREKGGVARNVCIFVDNLVNACIKVPN